MSLPSRLLGANPSIQVSSLLSGSLSTPSAKGAFVSPAFESIATVTTPGGDSFLTFTTIPQDYKHLQIRGIAKDTYSSGDGESTTITMRINDNTTSVYLGHFLRGNSAAASAGGSASATTSVDRLLSCTFGNATNFFSAGIVDFPDYSSTTKNKTMYSLSGGNLNVTTDKSNVYLGSGIFLSTAAITEIRITAPVSGFAVGTTFALYGIRG
jgi:hypothetical protein